MLINIPITTCPYFESGNGVREGIKLFRDSPFFEVGTGWNASRLVERTVHVRSFFQFGCAAKHYTRYTAAHTTMFSDSHAHDSPGMGA